MAAIGYRCARTAQATDTAQRSGTVRFWYAGTVRFWYAPEPFGRSITTSPTRLPGTPRRSLAAPGKHCPPSPCARGVSFDLVAPYTDAAGVTSSARTPAERCRSAALATALCSAMLGRAMSDFIAAHPNAVVVELGCGPETRMNRLAVPPAIDWYDVDFTSVVRLRLRILPQLGRIHLIAASLMSRTARQHPGGSFRDRGRRWPCRPIERGGERPVAGWPHPSLPGW